MERMPHPEALEAMAVAPDFLDIYHDQEMTVFGMTGPLHVLAEACPIDLHDPRVTLEAKNEFVVKAMNESEVAIRSEHEAYFSQVLQKHGLERKFTVAVPEQSDVFVAKPERPKPAPQKPKTEPVVAAVRPEHPKVSRQQVPEQAAPAKEPAHPETVADLMQADTAKDLGPMALAARLRPQPEAVAVPEPLEHTLSRSEMEAQYHYQSMYEAAPLETILPDSPLPETLPEPERTSTRMVAHEAVEGAPRVADESAETVPQELEAVLPFPAALASSSERHYFGEALVQPTWDEVLRESPLEFCTDFSEALRALEGAMELQLEDMDPEENQGSGSLNETLPIPETMLPLARAVAERLDALEPEERVLVAPMLQEIVGIAQLITTIEVSDDEATSLPGAVERLETQVAVLFERLGLAYEAEDIQQFTRLLLQPDFRPPTRRTQAALLEADLEHDGTHEAKTDRHASAAVLLANLEHDLSSMLGSLVLLHYAAVKARLAPVAGAAVR